jgi:beta-lactamase regulating signal transducer with metallopeptidase domain
MAHDILLRLLGAGIAASAAIVAMLALRSPLRKLFGARVAYQAWLVVPAMIAVALLPRPVVEHRSAVMVVLQASGTALAAPVAGAGFQWSGPLLGLWLGAAAALMLWFARAHLAFVRALGELVPGDGLFYSATPGAGPALLGLWRPKIVVPADFTQRYTAQEQALILAHERVHARRGDVVANLLQCALQCIFWVNPLVHLAALFFRSDQEMACDATVLGRHPGLLRTYAQALLKSQSFSTAAPSTVACSWRIHHPVKERFMTLQQSSPHPRRRFVGRLLVASMILGGSYAALAARADEAPGQQKYEVKFSWQESEGGQVKVEADEFLKRRDDKTPHIVVSAGKNFTLWEGTDWRADFVITPVSAANKTYKLSAKISDGKQEWRPALVGRLGEQTGVAVGGPGKVLKLAMVVTEVTDQPPAR